MKHGVKWVETPPVGLDRLPESYFVLGIPVQYNPAVDTIAQSVGFLKKKILIGNAWFRLSGVEQQAVLYHEAWHCLDFHLEKRLLLLPLCWTQWAQRIARKQEIDSDAYAAHVGYGEAMLRVIMRHQSGGPFYPSNKERIHALKTLLAR